MVPSIITDLESLDVLESNSNEQDRYRRELSEVMIGVRLCLIHRRSSRDRSKPLRPNIDYTVLRDKNSAFPQRS